MITDAEIAKLNAERFAAERKRDAERLAEYQRECLASWAARDAAKVAA